MNDKEKKLRDFEKLEIDPYTHAVLQKLGLDTLNSFTEEQRKKLIESISACRPLQKHPIDFRGSFSLFFFHFYFVFLMGRDSRKKTKMMEIGRRHRTGLVGSFFARSLVLFYVGITLLILFFILAYLLKSAMGINIFPDKHLCDFL